MHLLGAHNISMQQIRGSKTVQAANLQIKRITHNKISEHNRKKHTERNSYSSLDIISLPYCFVHRRIMVLKLQNVFMYSIENQIIITPAHSVNYLSIKE